MLDKRRPVCLIVLFSNFCRRPVTVETVDAALSAQTARHGDGVRRGILICINRNMNVRSVG